MRGDRCSIEGCRRAVAVKSITRRGNTYHAVCGKHRKEFRKMGKNDQSMGTSFLRCCDNGDLDEGHDCAK